MDKALIEAHIIPRSFYLADSRIIDMSESRIKRSPIGLYDTQILCSKCDSYIGNKYDSYAKKILIDRSDLIEVMFYDHITSQKEIIYKLSDKSMYEVISIFFISVLWRASISTRPEFEKVSLGKYENLAREVILGNAACDSVGFSVVLVCFSDTDVRFQLLPMTMHKIDSVNFYTFIAGGVKVFIKVDQRNPPRHIAPLILSAKNDILMFESKIKDIPERQILANMVARLSEYFTSTNATIKHD